jgi:hypothetical protein
MFQAVINGAYLLLLSAHCEIGFAVVTSGGSFFSQIIMDKVKADFDVKCGFYVPAVCVVALVEVGRWRWGRFWVG